MYRLISVLIIFVLFCQPALGMDAGASASLIVNSQLLSSEEEVTEQTCLMVVNRGEEDVVANFEFEGDLADTAIMDTIMGENITIPAGQSRDVEIVFNLRTTGKFEGKIYTYIRPAAESSSEGASSRVGMGLVTNVVVNVRGEAPEGQVKDVIVNDVEINRPLHVLVEFENKGNVSAQPVVKAEIVKDNVSLANIENSDTIILKGTSGVVDLVWDTTGQGTGEYLAGVEVFLGKETLEQGDHTFSILEAGNVNKQGSLEGISLQNEAKANGLLKVLSGFKNSGDVAVSASFLGEVYRNGDLFEVVESDEVLVQPGASCDIASYVTLGEAGEYEICGHVVYDGISTEDRKYTFSTAVSQSKSAPVGKLPLLFVLVAFALRKKK